MAKPSEEAGHSDSHFLSIFTPKKEAAAKAGLGYEAAKKRKQRAEAAILKALEGKK